MLLRFKTKSLNYRWQPLSSCTLYRTIYSILETTPAVFLKEIILVDDKSVLEERPELGVELEQYIEANFRGYVKLIRQPERHGLIKVRLLPHFYELTVSFETASLIKITFQKKNNTKPFTRLE